MIYNQKTSASLTIDEIIDNAEKLVSDGEIYTDESLDALKLSLDALKNIRKAYTTDKDNYIDTLSALYNTADDPIKGYGSVKMMMTKTFLQAEARQTD